VNSDERVQVIHFVTSSIEDATKRFVNTFTLGTSTIDNADSATGESFHYLLNDQNFFRTHEFPAFKSGRVQLVEEKTGTVSDVLTVQCCAGTLDISFISRDGFLVNTETPQ
jgi:hypothetical protein